MCGAEHTVQRATRGLTVQLTVLKKAVRLFTRLGDTKSTMISLGAPFRTTQITCSYHTSQVRAEMQAPCCLPKPAPRKGLRETRQRRAAACGLRHLWATGRNQTGNDTPRRLTLAKLSSTFHPSQFFDGRLLPPACAHCCCLPRSAGRGNPRRKAEQTKRLSTQRASISFYSTALGTGLRRSCRQGKEDGWGSHSLF